MALGEITKQLAGQALDALRTPESAPAQTHPDNPAAVMLGQLQAMQKALKDDEELLVHVAAAGEKIRVLECFLPGQQVVVLKGLDAEKNLVRVVARLDSLQLLSRPVKVQPGARPLRIAFLAPKKSE